MNIYILLVNHVQCIWFHTRVFDKFWTMDQIDSTLVNVCTIGNIFQANYRVDAVSDNIIIINCTHLAQRENCAVPNKKLFGSMVRHMSLLKHCFITIKEDIILHTFLLELRLSKDSLNFADARSFLPFLLPIVCK